MVEVYFNGHRLRDCVDRIRDIRRDILPPRTLMTQEVPGRDGAYLFDVKRGPRITEVDIMLIDRSFEALRERTEELAAILDTEETAELTFSDEGGKVRYAILDGETRLDEILYTGQTTLIFYQPDPHKYGPTRTRVIAAPPADFARSSSAYTEDGTQVSADEPRYEAGQFGSALMVEEGTTNLAPSPDPTTADLSYAAEVTDTTGVASFLQNGIYFGDNSVQRYAYEPCTVQPRTAYTFSCYVRMDDGLAPNVNSAKQSQYDFAIVIGGNAYPAIATDVGGGLYRVSGTATTSSSPAAHNGVVKYTEHSARGFKVSGFQLEQKPYATSFIDGTRANEVVTVPTEGVLSAEEGTIDVWVWVDEIVRRQQSGQWNRIFDIQKSVGGAGIGLYHQPGSPNWTLEVRGDDDVYQGVSVNDSYTPNGWNMFTIKWSAQEAVLLINGVRRGVINNPRLPSGLEDIAHIGSGGSTSHINTKFDSLRLSRIARTDEEISAYDLTKPLPVDEHTTAVYRFDGSLTAASPNVIDNQGTEPTYPTFRATVLEPTTFIDIVAHDDYMRLGYPIDVEQIEFEEEQLILHDRMSSTTGWTSGTQVDNGTVSGTMASDGSQFVVTDFGEESDAKWHGPALKTSLSEPLQNFRAEMILENMNDIETVGRAELYLLDEGNEIIAMISLRDAWQTIRRNRTSAFMRNPDTDERHYTIGIRETTKEATGELWNHFKGMLRLERIGNRWRSYIAKIRSDGTHHARETRWFTDIDEKFVSKVAQIQVHMGKFGGYPPTQMSIKDLKVWKINQPDDMQIPYIAYPGDEIVIDHQQNLVLRNGEPFLYVKDFGARFFPIQPGQTEIAVQPAESLSLTAEWRDVHK